MTDKLKDQKEIIKLETKIGKTMAAQFRAKSRVELNDEFDRLTRYFEELELTAKEDEELAAAREKVKQLNEPYREQKAWNKIRRRFIYLLMVEAGWAKTTTEVHNEIRKELDKLPEGTTIQVGGDDPVKVGKGK
ncbi:MAG: hypothetical protein DRP09_16710 [Candidatus Thorarchaeota archaeon]|nr:MAG: hypothetical protein DRP09_16710 [Candidatus Thorarchaeota archaeon]